MAAWGPEFSLLVSHAGNPSTAGAPPAESPGGIARLLEAILSEVRAAGDRLINLTVTTKLDGREIAQAVYKDLRERKIRNMIRSEGGADA